jgi:preprotein translocase subunit SecE
MTKREPLPKMSSSRATTIVVIIMLLPFVIAALSWAFDYVSRRL